MPYTLDNDEPLADGIRRCAREQLEAAIERIDSGLHEDPVGAVHDARKSLKKERSLLRLSRGMMKPGQRRQENAALRRNAHRLGQAREADALLGALDGIDEQFVGQIPEATVLAVGQRLAHERDHARRRLLEDQIPTRVADDLSGLLVRVDQWKVRDTGWKGLSSGLGREYKRGRQAMRRAAKSPTPERMHAWRKRSKDLWYQLRLLEPLAPGTVRGQAEDAHRLADLLGDLHDLALLEEAVRRVQADLPADTDALIALIEHRGEQLGAEALKLGQRVYAESPQAFLRRLQRYWRAWQAEARAQAAERPQLVSAMTRHAATT